MKTKKMQSLKNFEVSKEEMKNTTGGLYYGHGVYWAHVEGDVVLHRTGSIGTYVDGMSNGTDGYED
ncbi:hypothetical protein [Aquimarina sp. 2201CG5-10]|uniref:hypothetical protein n=1 Tax=Aquimarina callyspongiae TaxID=3098150 RepID=UPI002AB4AC87|nr:hypothetical protein [Aquimarina sp. 2201CG5-10]MDY8136438.1 hypothetical protein [Aquimarina sp. 2201CG5-10]